MTGINSKLPESQKIMHLQQLATYRDQILRKNPVLKHLFLELTAECNEHCRHCGSRCGDLHYGDTLKKEEYFSFLQQVKEDFPIDQMMLCITGGEPLLRRDFFEIMAYAHDLGFHWGMTSNGTLITRQVAGKLAETGMRTISISVDGLKESHEWFRQSPGSYEKTLQGIRNLLAEHAFSHVQITTVIHQKNIRELDEMYRVFSEIGVRSWRVIGIEPMGRAKEQEDLLLTAEQQKELLDFIVRHRFAGKMEVTYGCSHYLGLTYEREVRPWYFLCNAGVYTAGITCNGNMVSCLDLERRPELVEGNIRTDRFKEVWEHKYRIYRTDYRKTGKCAECEDYVFCAGDAFHSWNFDCMEPEICTKTWRL